MKKKDVASCHQGIDQQAGLTIAFYEVGSTNVHCMPLWQYTGDDIKVNAKQGEWEYRDPQGHVRKHGIGSEVRTFRKGEYANGPFLVYDSADPEHVAYFMRSCQDLRTGKLAA